MMKCRGWVVVLAVVLLGAASTSTVMHADHGVDQDCAICQLRHQPVAALTGTPQIASSDSPRQLSQTQTIVSPLSHRGSRIPARAPPRGDPAR